jgi:hypothetical protein
MQNVCGDWHHKNRIFTDAHGRPCATVCCYLKVHNNGWFIRLQLDTAHCPRRIIGIYIVNRHNVSELYRQPFLLVLFSQLVLPTISCVVRTQAQRHTASVFEPNAVTFQTIKNKKKCQYNNNQSPYRHLNMSEQWNEVTTGRQ